MQTITTTERGVALVSLVGEWALECLSQYARPFHLRSYERDAANALVDVGALNLRPWDPNGILPKGNGYYVELRDHSRRTLLAIGAVTQRGQRASVTLDFNSTNVSGGETITIVYPDLSDENVSPPPVVTIPYVYAVAPAVANEIRVGADYQESINNLLKVINGDLDYGDTYTAGPGTDSPVELAALFSAPGDELFIEARDGGLWANGVTVTPGGTGTPPTGGGNMTGGTGRRGLALQFEAGDLPNSLMETPKDVVRLCYLDIVGLDLDGKPTKIVASPADLHATATDGTGVPVPA